ncbi:Uu.00g026470.m01.CDS01 [Anthostomella pinea]|uniref:Uu.00g026470.m01.CDS01 n=1 Tax=Anthostomella pinea TaxID=933095 RepID=A0AAI8V7E5_9PEZI|nr:Uu.00g026470.m01.CDS01 [Anthostomella pinea]
MASSAKSNPEQPSAVPSSTEPPRPHSQPPSQAHPHPQSQSQSQKPPVDGSTYYGYLFNGDKTPTDLLNALLRAIGQYIIDHVGDTNDKQLDAKKLSAFYHAVGGDYDSLFVKAPNKSISYIWQALGVQHTFQPTDNDFEEPCIPALTLKGFARWQSLQILLGPEEHVPYIQYAVANWILSHPETGEPFPPDLPADAFPAVCDPKIDEWHRSCAARLREAVTPREEHPPRRHSSDPRIHATFNHVRSPLAGGVPRQRPEMDYFSRERSVPYVRVTANHFAGQPFSPRIPPEKRRLSSSSGSSLDDVPRRRSFSDLHSPQPKIDEKDMRSSAHHDPRRPPNLRRHSHPRPQSASSSESGTDNDVPSRPTFKTGPHGPAPPPSSSFRRVAGPPPPAASAFSSRARRNDIRADDPRRMSLPAGIKHKLTSMFPGSSDRHRSSSHETPTVPPIHPVRFRKEALPHSRLNRSQSGDSFVDEESDPQPTSPRYTSRNNRERMVEKEREREREIEEERERRSRKEREYLRPPMSRRTSSHNDGERRAGWEARDRERNRDWDRDDGRRAWTSDENQRRDRRRYNDRGPDHAETGVSGRRYPRQAGF